MARASTAAGIRSAVWTAAIRARLSSPIRWPARPARWTAEETDGGLWTMITSSRFPMSMPSSRELVAMMARSPPFFSFFSTSRRISLDREPW